MGISITTKAKSEGHSKPLPRLDLNLPGRLFIGHLMSFYSLGHSTVYEHMRRGYLPPPDGKVAGRKYWLTSTIREHLNAAVNCK